jgi:hypothetical protein
MEENMECTDFIMEFSRCKRGIPVAPLFREYFCKRNPFKCPFKKLGKSQGKTSIGVGLISFLDFRRYMKNFLKLLKSSTHVLYHIAVVALSAAIALSLPFTIRFVAKKFLVYWSFIENEKLFLISVEITAAVLLILFLNYAGRGLRDRKLSNMARNAGMVNFFSSEGLLAQRRKKKLVEKQGFARDIVIMGSTGFRTFVDPKGEFYNVMQNCREAKIMLLNPYSEGARIRASSILSPDITLERFREQIIKSIDFLKELKAVQKNIMLKLYEDPPFLKLAVLGDYLWVKHYHTGIDVKAMAQYVFEHNQNPSSLYTPFYQYFLKLWNDPKVPEYDLESDELVYRDLSGNGERRERFEKNENVALSHS